MKDYSLTPQALLSLAHFAPVRLLFFPDRDSHKTCSLVFTTVYYFRQCPLFKARWSLRDAVNFQSCEMDT